MTIRKQGSATGNVTEVEVPDGQETIVRTASAKSWDQDAEAALEQENAEDPAE
jgi:hypothetical protein